MAAHLPRDAADWAVSQGLSVAALFVDVVGAYYHALRQLIVGLPAGANLDALMERFCLEPTEKEELKHLIGQVAAIPDAEVPAHIAALAAEAVSGTWFVVSGANFAAKTTRGVRPGHPLADVLYLFLAVRCLRGARAALREAGLIHNVK